MDITLTRSLCREDGIFSFAIDDDGEHVMYTLEHAYSDGNGGWGAKIPVGTYKCVRGKHRLHGMTEDFDTFEITGVEGHSGLLFHWGNFNKDSEGCILVGKSIIKQLNGSGMITGSREEFAKFMELQKGLDYFQLTVRD